MQVMCASAVHACSFDMRQLLHPHLSCSTTVHRGSEQYEPVTNEPSTGDTYSRLLIIHMPKKKKIITQRFQFGHLMAIMSFQTCTTYCNVCVIPKEDLWLNFITQLMKKLMKSKGLKSSIIKVTQQLKNTGICQIQFTKAVWLNHLRVRLICFSSSTYLFI